MLKGGRKVGTDAWLRGSAPIDPAGVALRLRASYAADLGDVRAFLPDHVPLDALPRPFERYLSACAELPDRFPGERGGARRWLEVEFGREDPVVSRAILGLDAGESQTLMTVLSALGHTYRWDKVPPARERFEERRISLPPGIGGPWTELARALDQPRVGSAWSLHLCNWKLAGRQGGAPYKVEELTAETLRVAQNWLRPPVAAQLERFSLSFVLLEARGAAALAHIVDAVDAAARGSIDETAISLERLHRAIAAVTLAFSMSVRKSMVDPRTWLELVQPTFAWSAETTDRGCVEGGPSGLQLAIIQALDAALGISADSPLARSAMAARRFMPKCHRRFLGTVDLAGAMLRRFVLNNRCPNLIEQYNKCIRGVTSFRTAHRSRGVLYLSSPPEDGGRRVSTGLTIGVDEDPVAIFGRTMSERILETHAATLPPDRPVTCS